MSRKALLRALHDKPVTYSVTYTGPTRTERSAGVEWLRVHGHRTEQRGVLEVRSRDVVFWDSRWGRKTGNGKHFYLPCLRADGGALVFDGGGFRHELRAA